MNDEKLVAAISAVNVPEALDLTTNELNAIRAEAEDPFDMITLAFQCGFMRGQSATTDLLDLEPVKQRVQRIHSTILAVACALDGIRENGCEPAQFVPALYGVELEMMSLERDIYSAMDKDR